MKKTLSTRNIKPNTKLRFHKDDFGYGILKIVDNNDHFLTVRAKSDIFNNLTVNDLIEIYLWANNKGAFEWHTSVIGKIDDGKYIILRHTDSIKWYKEHKSLHVDTDLDVRFFIYDLHKNEKHHFDSEKTEMLNGKIIKLSDQEVILEYNGDLEEEIILKGHIILNKKEINIIGSIAQKVKGKNNLYKVSLSGTPEKEKSKILTYIFQKHK